MRIVPHRGLTLASVMEIPRYRALLWSLVMESWQLNYRPWWKGVFWVLARPVLLTVLLTTVRHATGGTIGTDLPAAVYILSGVVLWFNFADATITTAGSVGRIAGLIEKVYFPKLVAPLAPVINSLIDLGIGLLAVGVLCAVVGWAPDARILLLPLVVLPVVVMAFGLGCLFAAARTFMKDVEKLLGLIMFVGLFASPVYFSYALLSPTLHGVFALNPMGGPLILLRYALGDGAMAPWGYWAYSMGFAALAAVAGLAAFAAADRAFADRA